MVFIDIHGRETNKESYIARSLPSGETLKAQIGSRTTRFDFILVHVVALHFEILPP